MHLMAQTGPLPRFTAIVVAAGKGLRVGGEIPKQFRNWRGQPLLRHSVERLLDHGADHIIIAIPQGADDVARAALGGHDAVTFVTGGATRQQSVLHALEALAERGPSYVLIHDAARPDLPRAVTHGLIDALAAGNQGAIPVLPVVDSLAVDENGMMGASPDRDILRRVQTPQAFVYADILAAHRAWTGAPNAGDDAQVLAANGGAVALVDGHERLKKITFAEDLMDNSTQPAFRIGQGFDVHKLVEGEELWLCGIELDHTHGLAGHSDADVALHAITDAVLGAIGDGDIGTHFPPSDPQWKGARSGQFLEHAAKLVAQAGYRIGNIDLTIICEAPKIGPHRPAMRSEVARLTGMDESAISIKATTTERLGFTGRGEGIAAQAIASVERLA